VSIDAGPEHGVSTGISAEDRARTIQVALHPKSRPNDLRRPGHVFPLRAKAGGVLKRAGHTEAAVDIARLAGLYPAGVICEIQNTDGSMARLPELFSYAREHGLCLISIADLIRYRLTNERFVQRQAEARLPSQFGNFTAIGYHNSLDGQDHVALIKGNPSNCSEPVLVRVHSECLTGDAFGSLRCDCRPQLEAALRMIESEGCGVVVYLRQEGRGIGLINKLKAYNLQDGGLDTVEANEHLGFAADLRNYGVGAQILSDLGVKRLRLITNNPRKIAGLGGYGLEVVDRMPLVMDPGEHNARYLATKARKLGHLIEGPGAVLAWHHNNSCLEATRGVVAELLAQAAARYVQAEEEDCVRVLAVLNQPHLALRLSGIDGPSLTGACKQLIAHLAKNPDSQRIQLLLTPDLQRSEHPPAALATTQLPMQQLRQGDIQIPPLVGEGALLLWN
jgi:3,4-dihydroxy 2-butanone 4-phosphate synthase/GTP cyclohydrolase II